MKPRTKKEKKEKPTFIIEENLRQFFPPISRMGGKNPSSWEWRTSTQKLQEARMRKIP
jgi:hypothetical protein